MTSGSVWNYNRDEIDDVDNNASDGKSFEYKTKIGKTLARPGNRGDANRPPVPILNVEVTISFKYLSTFSLKQNLIYHGQKIVLIQLHNNIAGTNFMVTGTKLYVPAVTLSINDNIKPLENIK